MIADEPTRAPAAADDLDLLLPRLQMDGYVVLDAVIPLPLIDRMRARFDELLATRVAEQASNRGPNRYQMTLPFEPPFSDPLVYENPRVLAIMERLLGPDFICTYFASDTPLPGSDYQRVHADTRLLFPETSLSLPCYGAVLNIPLVDATEGNGSLELWPGGTHLMPGRLDLQALAETMVSIRANMKAGSVLLRDLRVWHRGTPNRSSRSRPNMALVYTRPWYRFEQPAMQLSRTAYDTLSDRARAMFRFNQLVDSAPIVR
jgi:hypothetical protein